MNPMKLMNPNVKIIVVVIATFLLAFFTSLLFELEIFGHWSRYGLVVLLMVIEIYFGWVIFKSFFKKNGTKFR